MQIFIRHHDLLIYNRDSQSIIPAKDPSGQMLDHIIFPVPAFIIKRQLDILVIYRIVILFLLALELLARSSFCSFPSTTLSIQIPVILSLYNSLYLSFIEGPVIRSRMIITKPGGLFKPPGESDVLYSFLIQIAGRIPNQSPEMRAALIRPS